MLQVPLRLGRKQVMCSTSEIHSYLALIEKSAAVEGSTTQHPFCQQEWSQKHPAFDGGSIFKIKCGEFFFFF